MNNHPQITQITRMLSAVRFRAARPKAATACAEGRGHEPVTIADGALALGPPRTPRAPVSDRRTARDRLRSDT